MPVLEYDFLFSFFSFCPVLVFFFCALVEGNKKGKLFCQCLSIISFSPSYFFFFFFFEFSFVFGSQVWTR